MTDEKKETLVPLGQITLSFGADERGVKVGMHVQATDIAEPVMDKVAAILQDALKPVDIADMLMQCNGFTPDADPLTEVQLADLETNPDLN